MGFMVGIPRVVIASGTKMVLAEGMFCKSCGESAILKMIHANSRERN